jgi:pimeloyl-ACP methyl ester carboxylesterase
MAIDMGRSLTSQPTSFDRLYARVDPAQATSLLDFRQRYPPQHLALNGVDWEYLALGEGDETILFLHGLAGSYDIWWQQMEALKDRYRIISVTYPAVSSLQALAQGLLTILNDKRVARASVVGSSLGGYLAQYLMAVHPERVARAVFGNTYADKDPIERKYGIAGALLPYAPQWLVMAVLRAGYRLLIYPSSRHLHLVLAYLCEQTHRRTSKAQIEGRYRCVVEPFPLPDPAAGNIPLLILESDNDPLIDPPVREDIKRTYPAAAVHTFHNAGHFPYLVVPMEYLRVLEAFLQD